MKLVYSIALPCALTYLSSAHAAYLSVEDPSDASWPDLQDLVLPMGEGLLFTHPLHDPVAHYLCDVLIGNTAFEISLRPERYVPAPVMI